MIPSEFVVAQCLYLIDVSDDREVCVILGFNLAGDLVCQFAGAGEHFDLHIGEGVRHAWFAGGAHVAAPFPSSCIDGIAGGPSRLDELG